jgi:hypothetical protein
VAAARLARHSTILDLVALRAANGTVSGAPSETEPMAANGMPRALASRATARFSSSITQQPVALKTLARCADVSASSYRPEQYQLR